MSDSTTVPDVKRVGYSQEERWAHEQSKRLIQKMREDRAKSPNIDTNEESPSAKVDR